tara:strand:+ start:860 stop:976 length:117 start_codon:yes stop_codon:yes gene_type:complete
MYHILMSGEDFMCNWFMTIQLLLFKQKQKKSSKKDDFA